MNGRHVIDDGSDRLSERLERLRELHNEELLDYVVRATPQFQRPDHLAQLAKLLDRSLERSIRALVSIPPQHGKSQLLLHHLVRLTVLKPQRQSAYITYGAEFSRDQAQLAAIIERRADPRPELERQTGGSWVTAGGGGVVWTGVMGPLTGRRVDGILIIDDPYKGRMDAESPAYQRKLIDWFQGVALPRLNPGASVLIVHARWHDNDLIGQLARGG